ncbi:MAG: MarR family transcriptional regulator [Candidatus Krumholzibacteriia bacterium]
MSDLDIRRAELLALKVMKTHERLEAGYSALFKAHGLSSPQYNVLRILRGARGEDLSCHEVGERLLKRVPDVTRLLDRLEQRGLIERWRCQEDRRVVRTRLTAAGLELVNSIDAPLQRLVAAQFGRYNERKLAQLDRLLDGLLDV